MFRTGTLAPRGTLGMRVIKTQPPLELSMRDVLRWGFPHLGCTREVFVWRLRNLPNLFRGLRQVALARVFGIPTHYGAVYARVTRGDGMVVDYGLASLRVVTDVGVQKIVDTLRTTDTVATGFKYHGFGTGTNVEAAADTALQTELTTQYNPDSTRPTGTQTNNGNNVYRTVATLTPDSGGTIAVTEHGIFSAASAGSLLDRSKFSAINLVASSDQLQTTYDLTLTSGS